MVYGFYQGSVRGLLLLIMLLASLSNEFRSGCPQELLYADDPVLIARSMEELIEEVKKWYGDFG